MQINPLQVTFKSNPEVTKAVLSDKTVSNPVQQYKEISKITPDYNVKVPLKYTYLGKEELPESTDVHLYKLENGQRVAVVPKKGPTIVKTYVNVGSMNEPDKVRGISHFIEHNLFNGSEGLEAGEFFATVNKLGATTNASTGFAATDYYIASNLLKKSDLETEVKIHASMLETPKFAKNMLEKEKGPVTSEINMILDDAENVATNKTLKNLFNIESTSKDIIGGTVDNINAITRKDVVDYYERNYYPANMTTVITGDVEPEEAIKLVSKHFQSRNTSVPKRDYEKLTPITKSVRNDLISDKTKAAIVSLGFIGPKNSDTKDKILLDAFQFFLVGSSVARLNKSLEEIQTNAFVTSDRISNKPDDNMVVLFSTATSDENSEDVIKLVFSEIKNLEKDPPTEQEMEIVKKKLKLNLAQVFESSDIINQVVGTAMLDNDLKSVLNFEKVIDNLTSKDMVDFAKKYFDLDRVAITVLHPATADMKSIKKNYERAHSVSFTGNVSEINHKEAIDLSKVNEYTAVNNFKVVTNDIKNDLATFNLMLSTEAPANVKPGASEVLSIILNRGSKFEDEKKFFTNLETKGIQASFHAGEKSIMASSMFLPSDGVSALKSAKEVLLNPRFTQSDLAFAKDTIKESLTNVPANSREPLLKELFSGQRYGISSKDILESIDSITLQDVQGLYLYIMKNAQGEAVVSAPFSKNPDLKNQLFSEISSDFPMLKPSKPSLFDSHIPVSESKIIVQEHNKSQAEIELAYKFKINDNLKDTISFNLLNTILGGTPSSRLFQDLRETQKLAYQVNSRMAYYGNSGVASMLIKTTTDDLATGPSFENMQKSIDGFKNHVKKIKEEKVSEEELESAKLTLKNRILSGAELTSDKNLSLLSGVESFYGVAYDNLALDMIDKITVDDIKATANYVFDSKPVVSVVATKDTLDNKKEYLSSLGKVVNYSA